MSIDPKLSFYFGIWTSILLLVASGGISFDGALPAAYVPMITKWCAILGAINSTILTGMSGYSSNKAGPLTSAPSAGIPPTLVRILIAAFLLSLFLASGSGAHAQSPRSRAQPQGPVLTGDLIKDIQTSKSTAPAVPTTTPDPAKCPLIWDPLKLCGLLTGNPEDDMQRVVKRIQGVGRDDMSYAIAKAKAADTLASKVRLQCMVAIMSAKDAAEGVSIKDDNGVVIPRPDPAFVTMIEDTAELVDGLAPGGPLMTQCAGAAQMFKTNTLAAINGIVTGAAGLAAGGIAFP